MCRRCRLLTGICSRCDRGNIYCGKACSAAARKASQRRSAERYQKSERGRALHAARQQRYLERREAKMTRQGSRRSLMEAASALLRALPARTMKRLTLFDRDDGDLAAACVATTCLPLPAVAPCEDADLGVP